MTGPVTIFVSMVAFGVALALLLASFPKAIAQVFPTSELGMANGFAQAGVGIGIGSVGCNKLLKGEINGRLVPYGSIGMTVAIAVFVAASMQ